MSSAHRVQIRLFRLFKLFRLHRIKIVIEVQNALCSWHGINNYVMITNQISMHARVNIPGRCRLLVCEIICFYINVRHLFFWQALHKHFPQSVYLTTSLEIIIYFVLACHWSGCLFFWVSYSFPDARDPNGWVIKTMFDTVFRPCIDTCVCKRMLVCSSLHATLDLDMSVFIDTSMHRKQRRSCPITMRGSLACTGP